jgi:hypothetical protein
MVVSCFHPKWWGRELCAPDLTLGGNRRTFYPGTLACQSGGANPQFRRGYRNIFPPTGPA